MTICSNSHSLLKAIQGGAHDTQSIIQRLDNREGPTALIWVPGHKGIPGNEAAELAKAAATTADTISFAIANTLVRCTITYPPSKRHRTAMVPENFSWKADCITTSIWEDEAYAQETHRSSRRTPTCWIRQPTLRAHWACRSRKH